MLRPTAIRTPGKSASPARLRLAAALAGMAALALAVLAGRASAGVSDYPSPLYLAGGASSVVSTSFQLVGGARPAVPATPTAAATGSAGSGGLSGSYAYVYTVDSGTGVFTASATSVS